MNFNWDFLCFIHLTVYPSFVSVNCKVLLENDFSVLISKWHEVGILQVLNGLLSRENQKEGISIPIGIIPAGSDNSLVWTVLGVRDPISAAMSIVKVLNWLKYVLFSHFLVILGNAFAHFPFIIVYAQA